MGVCACLCVAVSLYSLYHIGDHFKFSIFYHFKFNILLYLRTLCMQYYIIVVDILYINEIKYDSNLLKNKEPHMFRCGVEKTPKIDKSGKLSLRLQEIFFSYVSCQCIYLCMVDFPTNHSENFKTFG